MRDMLGTAVPIAFYGSKVGTFGICNSVLILALGVWLARRSVLWGLLVLVTVVALSVWGAIPRYFMMLLPLLLAGWALLIQAIAQRVPGTRVPNIVVGLGLGVVLVVNLLLCTDYIRIQRGFTRPVMDHKWVGFRHVGYLNVYHNAQWAGVHDLAAMIRSSTRPKQKLIGPEATVLTFLSGRQVYPAFSAVPYDGQRVQIGLGLFPVHREPKFPEYDDALAYLVSQGRLKAGKVLAGPVDGFWLASMEVNGWPPRPERADHPAPDEYEAYIERHNREPRSESSSRRHRQADTDADSPATAPVGGNATP
jgi:hypothetical protein